MSTPQFGIHRTLPSPPTLEPLPNGPAATIHPFSMPFSSSGMDRLTNWPHLKLVPAQCPTQHPLMAASSSLQSIRSSSDSRVGTCTLEIIACWVILESRLLADGVMMALHVQRRTVVAGCQAATRPDARPPAT